MKKCPFCAEEIQDEAVVCKHCNREIAGGNASVAPGSPRNIIGILILGALVAWFWIGGGLTMFTGAMYEAQKPAVNNMMTDIYAKVSSDAVTQYNITKRSGSKVDICVHAGMVSAAYLQAKDEVNYKFWKTIEAADCKEAGMPQP